MLISTLLFRMEKTLDQKEREDETQMEKRCNLNLKTKIAVLDFSVKTILWDRNMPILQRLPKNYEKKRSIP